MHPFPKSQERSGAGLAEHELRSPGITADAVTHRRTAIGMGPEHALNILIPIGLHTFQKAPLGTT
jgi:hypothetical protein